MNYVLEQAFLRADGLSELEQERVAMRIHETIERLDDVRWEDRFSQVEGALALVHEEAMRDDLDERPQTVV